jgi:biotin operon repressor
VAINLVMWRSRRRASLYSVMSISREAIDEAILGLERAGLAVVTARMVKASATLIYADELGLIAL